ncbi:hypothetical protein FACS189472_07180 [Alphaproteobacteria bacterium]|nr:hypothetical protein FACS189472_07180 [Alphaproteobacteria bacterium]
MVIRGMWAVLRLQDQVLPSSGSVAGMIGHINFDTKITGKRSVGNQHATFDEAGDGNVAILANAPLLDPTDEADDGNEATLANAPLLAPTC